MTKTIIELAREAGIDREEAHRPVEYRTPWNSCTDTELERFAQLVREDYRAELLAGSGEPQYRLSPDSKKPSLYDADQLAAAVLRERERCAKVADGYVGADPIADAIRAGETK